MAPSRRSVGAFLASLSLALGPVLACVGESDTAPGADSGTGTDDSGTSGSPDSNGDGDGAVDANIDAGSETGVDAATDANIDAGPPVVACTEKPIGGFNFRCNASASTVAAGGTILVGEYTLTRWWQSASCPAYHIGVATLFEEGGELFFRFHRYSKTSTTDPGTKFAGTSWLKPGAGGTLTRTELCDPATKGTSANGEYQYQVVVGDFDSLVFDFADHQETWRRD